MRLSRVSGRLASAIHSVYSRLQLGLKAAKAAEAFLLALRALVNSDGTSISGFGALTTLFLAEIGLVYWPLSMKAVACLRKPSSSLLEGMSLMEVMRPREPMPPSWMTLASRRTAPISSPQKPKLQCSLKADMLPRMTPLYSKKGRLHLMVSTTLGQALWISSRMWMRMGWAKGLAFAM